MSVLDPPKRQPPPPSPRLAPGRPRGLMMQLETITCYVQSITPKLLARRCTEAAGYAVLLGLQRATLNNPFARPSRKRYIARLIDEDPAMAQTFLGIVQTAWPLLDNSTRAKIVMLTSTDKVRAWVRVHHPETQP